MVPSRNSKARHFFLLVTISLNNNMVFIACLLHQKFLPNGELHNSISKHYSTSVNYKLMDLPCGISTNIKS
jgi:hypothetical protein